ncbi:MAG: hypothetical protein LBR08_02940 [Bacteroidales bacterium]|jgi:hypothetical protein|nr:hypothetical protein [Bacteroidales bacterium]
MDLGRVEHRSGFRVIHRKVGIAVVHLNKVASGGMKRLRSPVQRKGDVASLRMPAGIDGCGEAAGDFGIYLCHAAVLHKDGSRMLRAYVEEHRLRVVPAKGVAVHAAAVGERVEHHGRFVECFQMPLVNSHLPPVFVSGFNEAVCHVWINDVWGDEQENVAVTLPSCLFACKDFHREGFARVSAQEGCPLFPRDVHVAAATHLK